jgi:hypothetical protein
MHQFVKAGRSSAEQAKRLMMVTSRFRGTAGQQSMDRLHGAFKKTAKTS